MEARCSVTTPLSLSAADAIMILSSLLSSPFSLPPPLSSDPNPFPIPSPNFSSYPLPFRARHFLCPCRRRGASWDSNAESVRPGRFRFRDAEEGEEDGDPWRSDRKRRWWSDEFSDELEEEFDPFGDDDPVEEPLWDRIWIFKVFKAYGYMLPAIIASMLLATGPKAFLMALALPLGQSALSLAIDKFWGKASEGPRTKPRTKKKPFARSASDFNGQWQDESVGDYRETRGYAYQSWVSADGGSAAKGNDSRRPSFGGWDELDGQGDPRKGSERGQPATANRSPPKAEPVKKGKLSKRGRYRDVPLFLRLLIAVFPFLSSWTKIL